MKQSISESVKWLHTTNLPKKSGVSSFALYHFIFYQNLINRKWLEKKNIQILFTHITKEQKNEWVIILPHENPCFVMHEKSFIQILFAHITEEQRNGWVIILPYENPYTDARKVSAAVVGTPQP